MMSRKNGLQPASDIADRSRDGYDYHDDCNNYDDSVHPGAEDVCGDGIDSDCDGFGTSEEDDEDGDGRSDGEEHADGTDPLSPEQEDTGSDTAAPDTAPPEDTDTTDHSDLEPHTTDPRACGCAAGAAPITWEWILIPIFFTRRR